MKTSFSPTDTVQPAVRDAADLPQVTMCRGCCCGDAGRHPTVDHDAIAQDLLLRLRGQARARQSRCLWVCGSSNVVVVSPSSRARRAGARPAWIQRVLSVEVNDAIVEWVRGGGPGVAKLPTTLEHLLIEPFTFPGRAHTPAAD